MATLEGLIQSLSTTFTSDIIKPLTRGSIVKEKGSSTGLISELLLNRFVIGIMAIVAFFISYQ
ncbi:MAG: hypothetical protein ABR503_03055, partial [Chitinophagaceae bacterium]